MNADAFHAIDAAFNRARRLDAPERAAFLAALEADDPDVHREVLALLAAHESNDDFLDAPAIGRSLTDGAGAPSMPERIGSFTIERVLGAGGMGVVYLARQDVPARHVALKVIRHGAATPQLIGRFEREAEVLGRLTHPGIARVYESGWADTPTGRVPYLAMEYVEGPTITAYGAARALDRPARLGLVIQLCEAVHHAHQQGVVHRDLKPANVLVTDHDDGARVRLLDFGVARITDGDLATMHTDVGQLLGTLRYMSPEQAAGDPARIDTRSDIYSIGVLLFELLCGALPHDVDGLSLGDALTRIRRDPPRSLTSFDRTQRGDLATIVGTALANAPEDRYESASDLGRDLRRFLEDEPILAHPPSTAYVLRKFARRHRLLVGAGVAVAACALAATAISVTFAMAEARQRDLADQRFRDVQAMAETLLFDLDQHLVGVEGTLPARRALVEKGLPYLDRLAREAQGDVALTRSLGAGYLKLGDVQGNPQGPNLGDYGGALASYDKGIALLRALPDGDRDDRLALALGKRGDTLRRLNRPADAVEAYGEAVTIAETALRAEPDDVDRLRNASALHDRLVETLGTLGRLAEAQEHRLRSKEHMTRALALHRDDPQLVRDMAVARFKAGMSLLEGDPRAALEEFESFVTTMGALAVSAPNDPVYRRDLAIGHQRIGNALERLGRIDEAIDSYRRELAIVESRVAADPADQKARAELGPPCCKLGELHLGRGEFDAAHGWFERFVAHMDACIERTPDSASARRDHAVAAYKMAEYHLAVADDADDPRAAGAERDHAADWLRECRARFVALRADGLLAESDAGVLDALDEEIAALDAPAEARDTSSP